MVLINDSLLGKMTNTICKVEKTAADFIFYPKPLYKSLHQSFFYSFITILPSESGVTLHYSTITVPNCAAVFSTLHIVFVILPNNESLINTIFGNSACEIYTLR
jgi:hypothetical protein